MRLNLNTLRGEIQEHVEAQGMVAFQSLPRSVEPAAVYWDTDRHPDYREFVAAAAAAGVRMVTLYAREFTSDLFDDTLEQLTETRMDRDERRAIETRLNEIRAYEGFTCQIELSFDHAQRVYIFDLHTEWFDDLNDLIDRIQDFQEEDPDETPLGGYYSNN